jgi:hypothetical protein
MVCGERGKRARCWRDVRKGQALTCMSLLAGLWRQHASRHTARKERSLTRPHGWECCGLGANPRGSVL